MPAVQAQTHKGRGGRLRYIYIAQQVYETYVRAKMKVFGYVEPDDGDLRQLREVSFLVDSVQARSLGLFFLKCADEMGRPNWDHEHLSGGSNPDIIICKQR
jgi:hypothetical protein